MPAFKAFNVLFESKDAVIEHQPVMVNEVIKGLNIQEEGTYIDATFGRGGHSREILKHLGSKGRLFAMDRDPEAEPQAHQLSSKDQRFLFRRVAFSALSSFCKEFEVKGKINGILMDLGVSSPQLDTDSRGFSFRLEGPLDMRMDPTQGFSAAEWLNSANEDEIDFVLKEYGEERFHKRIARAIILARTNSPIESTLQLAEIIKKAVRQREKHKHPATRSFQGIRIFINRELEELNKGLDQGLEVLAPHGRLVVLSFHSLEDRIVKRFIQKNERGDPIPKHIPILAGDMKQVMRRIGKKMKPTAEEVERNPRARSAILRVAEKL